MNLKEELNTKLYTNDANITSKLEGDIYTIFEEVTSQPISGATLFKLVKGEYVDAKTVIDYEVNDITPEGFCQSNGTYYTQCGSWSGKYEYIYTLSEGIYSVIDLNGEEIEIILVVNTDMQKDIEAIVNQLKRPKETVYLCDDIKDKIAEKILNQTTSSKWGYTAKDIETLLEGLPMINIETLYSHLRGCTGVFDNEEFITYSIDVYHALIACLEGRELNVVEWD